MGSKHPVWGFHNNYFFFLEKYQIMRFSFNQYRIHPKGGEIGRARPRMFRNERIYYITSEVVFFLYKIFRKFSKLHFRYETNKTDNHSSDILLMCMRKDPLFSE